MAMYTIGFATLGVFLSLCLAQAASPPFEVLYPWNDDARKLHQLLEIEWKTVAASDSEAATPLRQMPPRDLWNLAESAGLFPQVPDGYSSFEKTAALGSLLRALESHPKKSEFVSLMLDNIAKTTVPTRKPRDWNEVSVHSHGGIAGELISGVMKVAKSADHRRIIEAIVATKDVEKISRLRTEIRLVADGADLERLLDGIESGAIEPAEVKTEAPLVLPPLSSGHSADTELQNPRKSTGRSEEGAPPPVQMDNQSPTKKSIIVVFLMAVPSVLWLLYKRRS